MTSLVKHIPVSFQRMLQTRVIEKAYAEGERLKEAGQYKEAVPHIERALELREAVLGSAHLEVASCLALLGEAQRLQGNYTHAEPLYERALAIWEGALGEDHPNVATSLNNLAELRFARHYLIESLPLLERAFTLSEQHLRQEVFGISEARLASFLRLRRAEEELLYALWWCCRPAKPDEAT